MDFTLETLEREVTERFLPSFKLGTKLSVGIQDKAGKDVWYGCTLKSKLVDQIARDAFYTLTFERADGTELKLTFQVPAKDLDINNERTPA